MSELWLGSWEGVARAIVLAAGGYFGLILLLRVAGKRATSKLNMFDWAVTVALGSMLATMALSPSVPLAVGLAAVATVIGLQYGIAWLALRSGLVRRIVKAEPALLYYQGTFLQDRMRKERITEEEIRAAVRAAGHGSLEPVTAVVFETSADLSILVEGADREDPSMSTLEDVHVPAEPGA